MTEQIDFPEDVATLRALLAERGIHKSDQEIDAAWSKYSETEHWAGWITPHPDQIDAFIPYIGEQA